MFDCIFENMFVKLFPLELALAYVHATDVFLFVRVALIANFGPRFHLARISEGFQASCTFEAVLNRLDTFLL